MMPGNPKQSGAGPAVHPKSGGLLLRVCGYRAVLESAYSYVGLLTGR